MERRALRSVTNETKLPLASTMKPKSSIPAPAARVEGSLKRKMADEPASAPKKTTTMVKCVVLRLWKREKKTLWDGGAGWR